MLKHSYYILLYLYKYTFYYRNIVRRESSGRSQQRPVSDGFYLQNSRITSNKVDPASMSFKDRMKMFQNN